MRHPSATDDAERTIDSVPQPSRPPSLEAPEPGERFLGPNGLIWTVQAITACDDRIVLTTPTPGSRTRHSAVGTRSKEGT